MTDLAAIVARDRTWAEDPLWQSRDGSEMWIDVPQLLADRRALLALLRETREALHRIAYSQESDLSVYAKFAESVAKEALAVFDAS